MNFGLFRETFILNITVVYNAAIVFGEASVFKAKDPVRVIFACKFNFAVACDRCQNLESFLDVFLVILLVFVREAQNKRVVRFAAGKLCDFAEAVSSRSYRKGLPQDVARAEIEKGKGTQFDPDVVKAFVAAYDQIDAARRRYADDSYAKSA